MIGRLTEIGNFPEYFDNSGGVLSEKYHLLVPTIQYGKNVRGAFFLSALQKYTHTHSLFLSLSHSFITSKQTQKRFFMKVYTEEIFLP